MSDFKVSLYKIHLKQSGHTAADGTEIKFRAYIEVGGTHENGSSKEVTIFFLAKDSAIPAKNGYRAGKKDWLYAPIEEMPMYIDILRNEKPTWIRVNIDDAAYTEISTVWEHAGEGE